MAIDLDMSKSYLSEIESGKKTASIELLNKYSHKFNIPVSSIIFFSEGLENKSLSEKARAATVKKVLKIMEWVTKGTTND